MNRKRVMRLVSLVAVVGAVRRLMGKSDRHKPNVWHDANAAADDSDKSS